MDYSKYFEDDKNKKIKSIVYKCLEERKKDED